MEWQVEWFANKTGTTIGTLAAGKRDEGWNYAVLNRDKAGNFQICKLGVDAFSLDDARSEFMCEMAAAETRQAGNWNLVGLPPLSGGKQTPYRLEL
jgi:hypothetical protein